MIRAIFVLITLFLASPSAARAEAPLRPAGYVIALDAQDEQCKAGAYIERQGQEVELQIWSPLFDGDAIVLRNAATSVTIETAKDKRLKLDLSRSPHKISGALPINSQFTELASILGELFKAKPAKAATNLVGRSENAPRIRMGADAVQHVVQGTQLALVWQGGTAPYAVEISHTGNKSRPLAAFKSEAPSAQVLLSRHAKTGAATLVIRDASGQMTQAKLRIVAKRPAAPFWLTSAAPTPEFGKLAEALWLLQRQPHHWDLEAAALAASLPDYAAARALLDELAQGRRPQK